MTFLQLSDFLFVEADGWMLLPQTPATRNYSEISIVAGGLRRLGDYPAGPYYAHHPAPSWPRQEHS